MAGDYNSALAIQLEAFEGAKKDVSEGRGGKLTAESVIEFEKRLKAYKKKLQVNKKTGAVNKPAPAINLLSL